MDSDTQRERAAPLRQIENNISALLRGDIAVARVGGNLIAENFRLLMH